MVVVVFGLSLNKVSENPLDTLLCLGQPGRVKKCPFLSALLKQTIRHLKSLGRWPGHPRLSSRVPHERDFSC